MRISDWSSDVCSSDLLVAHELRRDEIGDGGAPILPVADKLFLQLGAAHVLADGALFHLGRDDAAPGIVHLAAVHAVPASQGAWDALGSGLTLARAVRPGKAISLGLSQAATIFYTTHPLALTTPGKTRRP